MINRHPWLEIARRVIRLSQAEQLTLLAAGVAYYAFVSLVPLALLAVGIAATLGGEAFADQVTAALGDALTPTAQALLAETLVDETGRQGATVVGALGLLWGASRVLRGLDRAFSEVYGTVDEKSFVDTFWDSLIVALAIVAGLAVVATVEAIVAVTPVIGIGFIGSIFVIMGLIFAFLPMYVVFPGHNITIREALPGTFLAAVGWYLLTRVFGIYATLIDEQLIYGALGAVFLVLAWLYVASAIILLGAVCNTVIASRDINRQLQSPGHRQNLVEAMTDDATGAEEGLASDRDSARTRDRAADNEALREEIERLRDRIDSHEASVEQRTVTKSSLESDLKRYVRRRVRRGHARGWGPYLVLLYGTAMAIAAFYFLDGIWAILAMFVVWTSVLGLYVVMVLVSAGFSLLDVPGRLRDWIGDRRS